MKHIPFPEIGQFAQVVTNVLRQYQYVGDDAEGKAIYDVSKPKPIIKFTGTCKLHGTNFGACFNDSEGMWCQSRTNIITPE